MSGWDLRKSTDLIKVWTNSNGTAINQNIPAMRVEHYFPNIDDPGLILQALNEWRPEWDRSMSIIEELTQYRNANTQVHRLVNKAVLGT